FSPKIITDLQSCSTKTSRGSRWQITKEPQPRYTYQDLTRKTSSTGQLRIKAHLRHQGLIKYILEPGVPLSGAAANAVAKKHHETVNILMNFMSETVFKSVITPEVKKALTIVHLEESRKAKNSSAPSKPAEGQSESASALIHDAKKGKKKKRGPYCDPGKHNPAATSHDAEHCYQLHPELCPPHFSRPSEKATTQLVEVNDGHESEQISEANIKISTRGHSNLLYATAVGSAILVNQDGEKLILNNVLLVPSLTRSLISIPRMFKHSFNITKTIGDCVTVNVDNNLRIQGSTKNNLLELVNCSFLVIKSLSSCYHASPVKPNWHDRLGHPNPVYQKALVPESEVIECSI
ncbi:uncharacterized protein VP01_3491g1, partial [Puccinia sorghi]